MSDPVDQVLQQRLARRANAVLRIAWLRVHASLLYTVDEGGQLSAQLLDLVDVLEAQDRREVEG